MVLTQTQSTQQSQSQSQDVSALPSQNQKGRFDHLLKPVKNISLSWGIDIATELSNYAESLGITLDDGEGHDVDFAEAAILLQCTTTIYCRKVEHLYTLVMAAMEIVNQVKKRKSRKSNHGDDDDNDTDDDDACWDTEELNFLSLDIPAMDQKDIDRRQPDSGWNFPNAGNDPTLLTEIPHLLRNPIGPDNGDVNGNGTVRIGLGTIDENGALLLRGSMETGFDFGEDQLLSPNKLGSPSIVPLSFEDDDIDHAPSPEFMRGGDVSPLPFKEDETAHALGIAPGQPEVKTLKPWMVSRKQPAPVRERERQDPFLQLDPHDDMGMRARPVRNRSTVSKPRAHKKEEDIIVDLCLAEQILGPLPGPSSMKNHVTFSALAEPAAKMRKKRIAMKRMRPGLAVVRIMDAELEREEDADGGGGDFGAGGLFGDDDDGFDNGVDDGPGSSPLLSFEDDMAMPDLGEDLGLPSYNRGLLGTDRYWQDVVDGYQRACKRYMQETTNLWEKQVVNADLVERVEKWRERIFPALALEEKRPPYDIQGYGHNVLNRLVILEKDDEVLGDDIEMSTALQATDQFEVCRMFLATLQLANNYDVEILPDLENDDDHLSPKIKMLDSSRVQDLRRNPPPSPGAGAVGSLSVEEDELDISPPRRSTRRVPLADVTPMKPANESNIQTPSRSSSKESAAKGRRTSNRKRGRSGATGATPASKRKTIRKRTYLR